MQQLSRSESHSLVSGASPVSLYGPLPAVRRAAMGAQSPLHPPAQQPRPLASTHPICGPCSR